MADALLMGGPQTGLEIGLGGRRPPTIRAGGESAGLLVLVLPPSLWDPAERRFRYADHGWAGDHYRLTRHVTTEGLAVYEYVPRSGPTRPPSAPRPMGARRRFGEGLFPGNPEVSSGEDR